VRRGIGGAGALAFAVTILAAGGVVAHRGFSTERPVERAPGRSSYPTSADPAAGPGPAGTAGDALQDPAPYDARVTFARIRFGAGSGLSGLGGERSFFRRREPPWAHDTPRAERNFMRILGELTTVDAGRWTTVALDDPALFRYPMAYIVEVGYWRPSDAEVENLRAWLRKGGFLVVDDFRGNDILNFARQMERVLPELAQRSRTEGLPSIGGGIPGFIREVPLDHEVWDSFFRIEDPYDLAPPTFEQYRPIYLGIFEDNDPAKRLMVMINFNNDIAEYWEYSDRGYYPIDLANEAYKFGVNYMIYAMTH